MSRRASLALALIALGCGKPKPATTPPVVEPEPVQTTEIDEQGAEVFVRAAGRGATEEEAYAAAEIALAYEVLGDAGWAERLSIDVHRHGEDPQQVTSRDGVFEVTLGLSRPRVAMALSDLESAEPKTEGPAMWQEPLQAYVRAHMAARACEQRRALFEVECETGETGEADTAVVAMLQGVVLSSAYEGGVPIDAEGKPLRRPEFFTLWNGVPLAELPLVLEANRPSALAQDRVVSDAQGRVELPLAPGAALPTVSVTVDIDALLGPHPESLPSTQLRIEPRAKQGRRWGLVVLSPRKTGANDRAAVALRQQMESAGRGGPVELPGREVAGLRKARPEQLSQRASALGDSMGGRLDVLLVLSYKTRFASKMGGGRVWYEAEGTLLAFDVWAGEEVGRARTSVRADGVGDDGADAAAREKLAEALAREVIAKLPGG